MQTVLDSAKCLCAYAVHAMVKFQTPGRQKLLNLELGPSELAKRFGAERGRQRVNQSTTSRWLSGDSRPGGLHRELLMRLFRIPEDDWLLPEEKEERRRVFATARNA